MIGPQGGAMQFLSVVGLVVLLGLAWAMSYHPRRVRVRTVLWGLGLQFIFALIILKQDNWSFFGMIVLAALLVVYIMQEEQNKVLAGFKGVLAVLIGAAVAGGFVGMLAPESSGMAPRGRNGGRRRRQPSWCSPVDPASLRGARCGLRNRLADRQRHLRTDDLRRLQPESGGFPRAVRLRCAVPFRQSRGWAVLFCRH